MSSVLSQMNEHRSVRLFKDEPVEDQLIEDILDGARKAPSSHNLQAYSVIRVKDHANRERLAELAGGQDYVRKAPVFLVFIVDYYKHSLLSVKYETPLCLEEIDNLLVGAVDTAIVAQNTLLAAQSEGLGGVMIGGIRNNPAEVAELLQLPKYTMPVMGMCLGYAAEINEQKPRITKEAFFHEDVYQTEQLPNALDQYEEMTEAYYQKRNTNQKSSGWGKQTSAYLSASRRENLSAFILSQGLGLK